MAQNAQNTILIFTSCVQMSNICSFCLGPKVSWVVGRRGCTCSAEGVILLACFSVRIHETTSTAVVFGSLLDHYAVYLSVCC